MVKNECWRWLLLPFRQVLSSPSAHIKSKQRRVPPQECNKKEKKILQKARHKLLCGHLRASGVCRDRQVNGWSGMQSSTGKHLEGMQKSARMLLVDRHNCWNCRVAHKLDIRFSSFRIGFTLRMISLHQGSRGDDLIIPCDMPSPDFM